MAQQSKSIRAHVREDVSSQHLSSLEDDHPHIYACLYRIYRGKRQQKLVWTKRMLFIGYGTKHFCPSFFHMGFPRNYSNGSTVFLVDLGIKVVTNSTCLLLGVAEPSVKFHVRLEGMAKSSLKKLGCPAKHSGTRQCFTPDRRPQIHKS